MPIFGGIERTKLTHLTSGVRVCACVCKIVCQKMFVFCLSFVCMDIQGTKVIVQTFVGSGGMLANETLSLVFFIKGACGSSHYAINIMPMFSLII